MGFADFKNKLKEEWLENGNFIILGCRAITYKSLKLSIFEKFTG